MRTRSCDVGVAVWLVSLGVMLVASPAWAAPKKKKAAAAAEAPPAEAPPAAEPAQEKDVDSLMKESGASKKSKPAEEPAADNETPMADADVGEPDAWERPPMEEEKPKKVAPVKVDEPYGDGNRWEAGLQLGYGLKMGDADWSTLNPYGLGGGLRGGYELDNRFYIGVGAVYYLGESVDNATVMRGASTSIESKRENYLLAYAEGGYDIWIGDLILRPSIWLGMGFAFVDPHFLTGGLKTVSDFMIAPGISLLYVWDGWFIGGDLRYTAVTADGVASATLFFNIGLRFGL